MDAPETSDRGLRRFEKVDGIAGRGWADVGESSLATEPALWLTVRCPEDGPMAVVQLGVEAAGQLAVQLQFLVANHYQRTIQ